MIEYSTKARPSVVQLIGNTTARLKIRAEKLAADKRDAERRGDGAALRRLKVSERALQLRSMTLKEAIEVARKRT